MGDSSRTQARELASWKEIGDYLGVNVRTAQKWEQERGLPVRRLPGGKGRVSADSSALDEWKARTTEQPRWWNSLPNVRYYAIAMTAVAVLTTTLFLREIIGRGRQGPPAQFRVQYATFSVLDASGLELWKHTLPEPLSIAAYGGEEGQQRVWFGDLDGDSRVETLFVNFPTRAATSESPGTTLLCFGEDGRVKWRFDPGRPVSEAGGATYSPNYIIAGFVVDDLGVGRGRLVALTTRHTLNYPTHFVLLDSRGGLAAEYWHSGHLDYMNFLDLDGDGVKEILLAGVNNGFRAATLVVLDPRDCAGASTQGGSKYQLQGLPTGKEKAVVFFQRTCLNRRSEMYNMARMITGLGDRFRVRVYESLRADGNESVLYTLDRSLRVVQVQVTDSFRLAHSHLEASGELDHKLTEQEIQNLAELKVYRSAKDLSADAPIIGSEGTRPPARIPAHLRALNHR